VWVGWVATDPPLGQLHLFNWSTMPVDATVTDIGTREEAERTFISAGTLSLFACVCVYVECVCVWWRRLVRLWPDAPPATHTQMHTHTCTTSSHSHSWIPCCACGALPNKPCLPLLSGSCLHGRRTCGGGACEVLDCQSGCDRSALPSQRTSSTWPSAHPLTRSLFATAPYHTLATCFRDPQAVHREDWHVPSAQLKLFTQCQGSRW
jgi:hypothetical protein